LIFEPSPYCGSVIDSPKSITLKISTLLRQIPAALVADLDNQVPGQRFASKRFLSAKPFLVGGIVRSGRGVAGFAAAKFLETVENGHKCQSNRARF